MRIRKNLKLFSTSSPSSPSSSSSKDDSFHPHSKDGTFDSHSKDATFHPHMCQLNQSPWDLIPLSSESMYQQFECDDNSFTVTTTPTANVATNDDSINNDSIIATNCNSIAHGVEKHNVASVMEIDEQEMMKLRVDEAVMAFMMLVNYTNESSTKAAVNANKEIMAGNVINENNNDGGNNKKPLITIPMKGRRSNNRKRRAVITFKEPVAVVKRNSSSSKTPSKNLDDFYYYSGFGPTWNTKRRGQREARENNVGLENSSGLQGLQRNVGIKTISTATTSSGTTITTIENGNNNSTIEKNVEGFNYDLDLNDDKDKEKDKSNYDYDYDSGKNKKMKK